MHKKKCPICGTNFTTDKAIKKYCKIQCAWQQGRNRRNEFGNVIPDHMLIRKKEVKLFNSEYFDWRDYPYNAIV